MREVTVTYDVQDATPGTTFELWLKVASGPWTLREVGLAETVNPTQDFALRGLADGTAHAVRARMSAGGRYRDEYQSADPDNWPAESLIEFTTGGP